MSNHRTTTELCYSDPKRTSSGDLMSSRLDRLAARMVATEEVLSALATRISNERHEGTLEGSIASMISDYSIDLRRISQLQLVAEVARRMRLDPFCDSESGARRALISLLNERRLPQTLAITGWLPGETVFIGNQRFVLTGARCEGCWVNPSAYGVGGGIRCIDQVAGGCRYWFCY